MGISHVYTSPVADGTATSVVRPSDWNSAHAYTLQDAVSLAGNTSGVLADISSGRLMLAGGSNVTLSQDGNSVSVHAAERVPYSGASTRLDLGTNWLSGVQGVAFNTGDLARTVSEGVLVFDLKNRAMSLDSMGGSGNTG